MSKKHSNGKGDLMRPCDWDKYAKNYEKIFGKRCVKCKNLLNNCTCSDVYKKGN